MSVALISAVCSYNGDNLILLMLSLLRPPHTQLSNTKTAKTNKQTNKKLLKFAIN